MAQDHGFCCARLLLRLEERAPQHGIDAECTKNTGRDAAPDHLFGLAVAGQTKASTFKRAHLLEHTVALLPVGVIAERDRAVSYAEHRRLFPDHHKSIGLG